MFKLRNKENKNTIGDREEATRGGRGDRHSLDFLKGFPKDKMRGGYR